MCTYLSRQEVFFSKKSAIFEDKFTKHTSTFREAALKLRSQLYEWLWHIWIKQPAAHWHKFNIETFDINTVLVTWDYANRNPMIGSCKSTCERDPLWDVWWLLVSTTQRCVRNQNLKRRVNLEQ